jgi:aspartate carbamoyltransferase regulatory subunit
MINDLRSFVIVEVKHGKKNLKMNEGRYLSYKPNQAASKVATKVCSIYNLKDKSITLTITIRESTQNSKKKEYKYKVTRKLLSENKIKQLEEEMIRPVNYVNSVKSLNLIS